MFRVSPMASLMEFFGLRYFDWKEMVLTLSTLSWYGIHTGSHALLRTFFVVSTTLEIVFAPTLWQRVLIQSFVSVRMLSVIFTDI